MVLSFSCEAATFTFPSPSSLRRLIPSSHDDAVTIGLFRLRDGKGREGYTGSGERGRCGIPFSRSRFFHQVPQDCLLRLISDGYGGFSVRRCGIVGDKKGSSTAVPNNCQTNLEIIVIVKPGTQATNKHSHSQAYFANHRHKTRFLISQPIPSS